MYLVVDAGQVPPVVEIREPDDFTSLKAVVVRTTHLWIDPTTLTTLAGRAEDEGWKAQLARMIDYAASKGWLDEHGRMRAHVEIQDDE